jgi:hypothetical protein
MLLDVWTHTCLNLLLLEYFLAEAVYDHWVKCKLNDTLENLYFERARLC